MWLPESMESLPSQQQGDSRVLKIVYFLENCIGTSDWQCHDIGGICCYVCSTKQDRKTYALRGISWYHWMYNTVDNVSHTLRLFD